MNPALLISEPPLAGHTASSSGIFGGVKRLRNEPAGPVGHSGNRVIKVGVVTFNVAFLSTPTLTPQRNPVGPLHCPCSSDCCWERWINFLPFLGPSGEGVAAGSLDCWDVAGWRSCPGELGWVPALPGASPPGTIFAKGLRATI